MMKIKNKKAGIIDLFIWLILAFTFVLVFGIFLFSTNLISNALENKTDIIQNVIDDKDNASQIFEDTVGTTVESFNILKWGITVLIVGYVIAMIFSGFLVRTSRAGFILHILASALAVVVSVPLSNTYETISQETVISGTLSGLLGANYIMANLPIWITVIAFIYAIVLYVNWKQAEGEVFTQISYKK